MFRYHWNFLAPMQVNNSDKGKTKALSEQINCSAKETIYEVLTMQTRPIQLTDVVYNAANQSFEALVTVHDGKCSRKYACAINAPISTSFQDAADGVARQALRRHTSKVGVYSEVRFPAPTQRAGRRSFDPMRWLENLADLSGRRAA